MKNFIKSLFLLFALLQTAQAGRYYHSDYGRFVSRDPIGYEDGMSLYNAYFAEKFSLDPSGESITGIGQQSRLHIDGGIGGLSGGASGGAGAAIITSIVSIIERERRLSPEPWSPEEETDNQPESSTDDPSPSPHAGPGSSPKRQPKVNPPPPGPPPNQDDKTDEEECPKKGKCKPCVPPIGTVMYEIAAPGSRQRGRHSKPGHNNGHVKLWVVRQTPYPSCKCVWNKNNPFTLDNTQTPPAGSVPGGPPSAQPAGGGPMP